MIDITCPHCGGQKYIPLNNNEYRCRYCDQTFALRSEEPPVAIRSNAKSNNDLEDIEQMIGKLASLFDI